MSRPSNGLAACLLFAVTCLAGCNNSSSTSLSTLMGAEGEKQAAEAGEVADGELFTSVVAEDFVVACGRTQKSPEGFLQEGHEALGCAVLNAVDNSKTAETVTNLTITLTLDDTTSREPLLTIAAGSDKWHYFLQLPTGEWDRVKAIESHVTVKGAPIVKVNDDPHAYDPESIGTSGG